MPEADAQEGVEEEHEARGEAGFGRGAIDGGAVRAHGEQLVPEAEVDAEIDERSPGHKRGRGEDGAMIGSEDRGEEDGEQTGDAEQHAVEQHAVLLLRLIGIRLPQRDPRHGVGGELDGIGHGLAGLKAQPERVGAVALERLGTEAERGRDGGDAGGIELGAQHTGISERVARRHQPAHDALVGGVRQGEDEPAGIGAGRRGLHRHAADIAVRPRRGLDLEPVAAALVELALGRDVDLGLGGVDLDRLDGMGKPRHQRNQHEENDTDKRARRAPAVMPTGGRLSAGRGVRRHHSPPFPPRGRP